MKRQLALERSLMHAEPKNAYFVRVYCRTLVKEIRDGFAGVQNDHLRSRKFETKDIGVCDYMASTTKVLARESQEMIASYRAVWPNLTALPRVGRRGENPGGFR